MNVSGEAVSAYLIAAASYPETVGKIMEEDN
jgi:hypothetical protein